MTTDYLGRIGNLIRDARKHRGLTQQQLAERLGTSQSAINRIERGPPEPLPRDAGPHRRRPRLRDRRPRRRPDAPAGHRPHDALRLIDVKTSKNAGVALLCASLLNRGRTTLRKVARIEEVNRLLEVLTASACRPAGSTTTTSRSSRPAELDLGDIDEPAARRTRSVIMFLGPLLHRERDLRAAVRRRLQPRHPHRRAAHVRAAPVRPRGQGHRRHVPREVSTARSSRRARSCSPSAATPSPRTP